MADLPSPLYSGASGATPRSGSSTIKLQPDVRQLRSLFDAMNKMDANSKTLLKNEVSSISAWSARQIKMGSADAIMVGQASRIATTVRANKDRVPNVTIGGSRAKFSGGAVSGMVVMGNEWGSLNKSRNGGSRFPLPTYPKGNWIFPTLRRIQPTVTHRWKEAIDRFVIEPWGKDG